MATDHLVDEHRLHPTEHLHRDWPFRRSPAMRYGVAVLAVAVAFAIRYLIYGDFLNRQVFTFFVPAALVAAWYGGMGPGILATVLGLLIGDYFFIPPRYSLWPLGSRELMLVGAYAVTTAVCVILCQNLHNHIRRLEHALDRERHHHDPTPPPQAHASPPDAATTQPQRGWPFGRSFTERYGVAVGVVVLAFALRYWVFGTQDHRFPFIFFVPAAMIAAWYGGMAPGLLATAAGLMLGDYFFLSEHEALGLVREGERLAIGLFAVTTTLCVMLFENLHNHIRRLEHALEHALHHHHKPHPPIPSDSASPP